MPLVFLPGLVPGLVPAASQDPWFAPLTVLAMVLTVLPLMALARPADETLWAWAILGLFILGYFVQTFLVSRYLLDRLFVQTQVNPEWTWLTPRVLCNGYAWAVFAYAVLCVVISGLLTLGASDVRLRPRPAHPVATSRVALWLLACMVLSLSTLWVRGAWGLGVLGVVPTTRLPLGLDTLLFRMHSHLLPLLILCGVWVADRAGRSLLHWFAVAIALAHALGLAYVSTSKGPMVQFAVPVGALWLLSGRLTRVRTVGVCLALLGLLASYPVFGALRAARMQAASGTQSVVVGEDVLSPRERIAQVARAITLRAIGASGIWYALRHSEQAPSLDLPAPPRVDPLVIYFTRDVVGVVTPADFRSPGLTGAFMLEGRLPGVLVGWTLVPLVIWSLWRVLRRARAAPVLMAFFLLEVLNFVSEGTLQWQGPTVFCLVAVFVELAYRTVLAPSRPQTP